MSTVSTASVAVSHTAAAAAATSSATTIASRPGFSAHA